MEFFTYTEKFTERQKCLIDKTLEIYDIRKPVNKEKRVCKYPNCSTILNQYNFSDYCNAHKMIEGIRGDNERV